MLQLNRTEMREAYRRMRTIREFEERLHVEFSNGQIPGFVHLYAGEEAVAVGVCQQLRTSATTSPAPIAATATASPRAATSRR
jgi:TPP-dependent pyruvate/acetoin dehydrogenase alpha subunit